MFEREVMIASLRKQRDTLKELIVELEDKPRFGSHDYVYCQEVMKKVENTLKKLRHPDFIKNS